MDENRNLFDVDPTPEETNDAPSAQEDRQSAEPAADSAAQTPEASTGEDAGQQAQQPQQTAAQPGGYYSGAGVGRKEYSNPYGYQGYQQPYNGYQNYQQPYYGYQQPYQQQQQPYHQQPVPKAQKKEKKRSRVGGVIAACLVCAILAGLGSGIITSNVVSSRYEQSSSAMQEALQSQIDALKSSGSSTVSASPIASTTGLSAAQVYQQNVNAVVYIESQTVVNYYGREAEATSSGSGFIISSDGYVLTNYHVVENTKKLTVKTYSGDSYDATLVGYDASSDVAVLKINGTDLPCVKIGDSDSVNVGDQVVAIGNPLGELTSTLTGGYVSAKGRTITTENTLTNMIQTDAAINSGNSGGPLFNMNGEVIGITSAKYSGSSSSGASIEGIGFAIPINEVMDMVDDLKTYGYVTGQAYLGVEVQNIDSSLAKYGLPAGVYVNSITSGSCSEKAGIQQGDIITALNGTAITSYDDLAAALKTFGAGDTTTITIYRKGVEKTLTITFDEKVVNRATTETEPTASAEPSEDQNSNEYGDYSWEDIFGNIFGR